MDAKSRRVHSVASFDELPKMLPELKLHYGQTLWLLTELAFAGLQHSARSLSTSSRYASSEFHSMLMKFFTHKEVLRRTTPIITLWNWRWRLHYAYITLFPTRC